MTKSQIFSQAHRTAAYYFKYQLYGAFDSYAEAFAAALKQAWYTYRVAKSRDENAACEKFYSTNPERLQRARMTD